MIKGLFKEYKADKDQVVRLLSDEESKLLPEGKCLNNWEGEFE